MEQINQTIRQKEVSVEHILETQYELVTTTNAVRTDLDYRQYRFHESISQLISELGEIKRNIVSVPKQISTSKVIIRTPRSRMN